MNDEITLRETIKTINTTSGYNPTGHWPDLRCEPFRGDRTSGGILPSLPITVCPLEGERCTVILNKKTHTLRYQDETESGVVIVIEPR